MTFVERCLYEYKANVASIGVMTEEIGDLQSVHGQSYEAHTVNGVSDPVCEVTARIMNLEAKISKTERKVRPVEKLRSDLSGSDLKQSQMREVLELKYIGHESNRETQRQMSVSEATFWRRKRELLRFAKRYFHNEI